MLTAPSHLWPGLLVIIIGCFFIFVYSLSTMTQSHFQDLEASIDLKLVILQEV